MSKAAPAKAGKEAPKAAPVAKKVKVIKEVIKVDPQVKKRAFFERLTRYLQTYSKVLIITVDNVGANHLQRVRKQYRGQAEVLLGKNTLMRKCIRQYVEAGHPEFEPLMNVLRGNVGLIFTNGDLRSMRNDVTSFRVPAAAKAGIIAPSDVHIPAGPTGLEPTATAFLQALNIPSKIVKGQVELTSVVHLIKKGDVVKPGAAALLQKLKITPFSFGIDVHQVYNGGFVYGADLLEMTDRDVLSKFAVGLSNIAAIGLQIGYPTLASVPHTIVKAFKNLVAVGVQTNYSFGPVDSVKERIKNPGAFAAAAPAAGAAPAKGGAAAPAAAAAAPEPKEASEEEEMELDLFG
jgi:large subunit ribosomal protein LP0